MDDLQPRPPSRWSLIDRIGGEMASLILFFPFLGACLGAIPAAIWAIVGHVRGSNFNEGDWPLPIGISMFAGIGLGLLVGIGLAVHTFRERRGEWRRETGRCPKCGYDMRATPHRCPECGSSHLFPPSR